MNEPFNLDFVLKSFDFKGKYRDFDTKNDGNINSTYVLSFDEGGCEKKYTLQKINTYVFKKPDELMQNITGITQHIRKKGDMLTLNFIRSKNGKYFCTDDDGNYWRSYEYIDGVYTCNTIDNADVFKSSGKAFGRFQSILSDYPIDTLYETIPDFHNTYKRFLAFKRSLESAPEERKAPMKEEINYLLSKEEDCGYLVGLIKNGELPLRVTHNDTKLNNILFDNATDEGVCIIDLDTVMPGLSLYDFGDSIRFGANTAAEDERDTRKISLDLELFKAYSEGYLSEAKDSLTEREISLLPFSAYIMTLELALRFLTDLLDGDIYFKTNYPGHNAVRTRAQLALCKDIEKKLPEMQGITEAIINA
ncbi:MAG: aminoglycoside phosphotransferase family protein [Clostridia bacterium]|nr:aminoglycoside phosphotransferase family protein [Clostridia bacterium]